ncbi:MAG: AAA family ATPase [bacterium]|nr:AAA family ATPase [bacterium]
MLTRIEIDGFKSFEDFRLDLSPFAVVLGTNAAGKSNLFDALQLLSHLATEGLRESVQGLRGDVDELFRRRQPDSSETTMRFAVEVVVDPLVRDPWGAEVKLKHTRMRYEVTIERTTDPRGVERLVVGRESAFPILKKDDPWRPFGKTPSQAFRKTYMKYSRKVPWLETIADDGQVSFKLHHDGKAGRTRPAHAPEATVISSITTAEFPHLFALREEMRAWRLLQLDPASLRRSSPILAPEQLLPDGSNLAAVLARIRSRTQDEALPKGALADISAELASIIPGVLDVDVEEDKYTREYRALVTLRDGFQFPTRVISDGTLRVLALLTLLYDPQHRGLICFEEPENGIHPKRLRTLMRRLRELVTDPTDQEAEPEEPLSQLLMNSHSPVVLSALTGDGPDHELPSQVLFADLVAITGQKSMEIRRKTRVRPVVPNPDLNRTGPGIQAPDDFRAISSEQ